MIHIKLDGVPPSVNHAYITRHGRRILSAGGTKYKNETKTKIAQNYYKELTQLKPDTQTVIKIVLGMPDMFNKNFGKPVGGAKFRYKQIDVSNRIKLLEDVLKDVTNVDDCCNEVLIVQKVLSERETTDIYISQEPSEYGGIFQIQLDRTIPTPTAEGGVCLSKENKGRTSKNNVGGTGGK